MVTPFRPSADLACPQPFESVISSEQSGHVLDPSSPLTKLGLAVVTVVVTVVVIVVVVVVVDMVVVMVVVVAGVDLQIGV